MARVCHCVGHLTNPGGVCCQDLPIPSESTVVTGNTTAVPLTEEAIREIVREELRKQRTIRPKPRD